MTDLLWKSPIYRFRVPTDDDDNLKEVVVDVTGSAPSQGEPSKALQTTLKNIFSNSEYGEIESVLEFGAGKLKNIPFLLKQGKNVGAVEFEELGENDITKRNVKIASKHGKRFEKLLFPNPFISNSKKYDLALLLNVPPVMPVPAERLILLDILHQKINDGKYLLWLAQKEGSYKKIKEEGKNNLGDGLWMGKKTHFKTFYKYFQVEELDEVMYLYGFKLEKRFNVPDDARLYKRMDESLFRGLLTQEKIREHIPLDESIKNPTTSKLKIVEQKASTKIIEPNPEELSIENLYIERLKKIIPGHDGAYEYQRIVAHALGRIFRGALKNLLMEFKTADGIKRLDIVFTNSARDGFFLKLTNIVNCNYPMIEVKNISHDPANAEFDQLAGRFNNNRGNFGILVCRKIEDKEKVINRCRSYLPDRYIIALSEDDLVELLEFSRESMFEEIDEFIDTKLKQVIF
jgi:hypothetical protein